MSAADFPLAPEERKNYRRSRGVSAPGLVLFPFSKPVGLPDGSPKRCTTRRKHLCWGGSDRKIHWCLGAAPLSLVASAILKASCRLEGQLASRPVHGIDRRKLEGTAMESFWPP